MNLNFIKIYNFSFLLWKSHNSDIKKMYFFKLIIIRKKLQNRHLSTESGHQQNSIKHNLHNL